METPTRSLVKAVIWSSIGVVSMALVGFVATGSVVLGGSMALVNSVIGFACYLLYERAWARILWGLGDV